jgi:hypothetical protein
VDIARQKAEATRKAEKAGKRFSEPFENDRGQLVQKNLDTGEIVVKDQEQDEFSEPYEDARGQLVQKNLRSGEIVVKDQEPQEFKPEKGVNVRLPDGQRRISFDGGRTVMIGGKKVPTPEGSQIEGVSVQGKTADVAPGPLGKKLTEKATEGAVSAAEKLATAVDMLEQFNRAGPRAVGIPALIAEKGGGLLGQLSPEAGESLTHFMTGIGAEQLAQLRESAFAFTASMIPEVTGEESGRTSDIERKLTEIAVKVRDPLASLPQIRGAVGSAIIFVLADQDKNLIVAGNEPAEDLETKEGRFQRFDEAREYGLGMEQAADLVRLLALQRRELAKVIKGQKQAK